MSNEINHEHAMGFALTALFAAARQKGYPLGDAIYGTARGFGTFLKAVVREEKGKPHREAMNAILNAIKEGYDAADTSQVIEALSHLEAEGTAIVQPAKKLLTAVEKSM